MAVAPKAHDPMSFFGATRGPLDATRGNGGEGKKKIKWVETTNQIKIDANVNFDDMSIGN